MVAKLSVARAAAAMLIAMAQIASAEPAVASSDVQAALLKRWALSRCLAKVYSEPAARNDANSTASAYLEAGDLPIDAYNTIDQLATGYANQNYAGSIDSAFGTKKCIDLFDSKALDDLTKRLVRAQSR